MQAIDHYLIQEVEQAYVKMEAMKAKMVAQNREMMMMRSDNYRLEQMNLALHEENDTQRSDLILARQESDMLKDYAEWVEERVAINRRYEKNVRMPRNVLRRMYMRDERRVVMRNVAQPDILYVTENMIDWNEIIDLTQE